MRFVVPKRIAVIIHDNAWSHMAKPVKTYLKNLECEVLPHPTCSPDISPNNQHLFLSIRAGKAFILSKKQKNGFIHGLLKI